MRRQGQAIYVPTRPQPPKASDELLLTVNEAAFLTGKTVDSIRWSIRVQKLKTVKVGHMSLIPASELENVTH